MLSEDFKNNYFKTELTFENYIKQTIGNRTQIEHGAFSTEGELYTYEIIFKDEAGNLNPVQKTFIVQLKEGTQFELAFNIN